MQMLLQTSKKKALSKSIRKGGRSKYLANAALLQAGAHRRAEIQIGKGGGPIELTLQGGEVIIENR